jgi:hypothetical protein
MIVYFTWLYFLSLMYLTKIKDLSHGVMYTDLELVITSIYNTYVDIQSGCLKLFYKKVLFEYHGCS